MAAGAPDETADSRSCCGARPLGERSFVGTVVDQRFAMDPFHSGDSEIEMIRIRA